RSRCGADTWPCRRSIVPGPCSARRPRSAAERLPARPTAAAVTLASMAVLRTAIAAPLAAMLALALLGSTASPPAEASRAGTQCAPARLNNSALLGGAVTISPLPGSRDASPRTQISFLGVPAGALAVASVVGSRTGSHRGRLLAYSQGDGASFVPARPFAAGERVTVHAKLRRGAKVLALTDQFAIERPDRISTTPLRAAPVGVGRPGVQSFVSRPDLHPPAVT